VDGYYSLADSLCQRKKIGIAAQIAASAYGDFVGNCAESFLGHLEDHLIQGLESRIALSYGTGAVVTAFLKGHAVLAPKGLDTLYPFEIAVAAKSLTVKARPSSHVGKYLHIRRGHC
jgi:hypothetical protein